MLLSNYSGLVISNFFIIIYFFISTKPLVYCFLFIIKFYFITNSYLGYKNVVIINKLKYINYKISN